MPGKALIKLHVLVAPAFRQPSVNHNGKGLEMTGLPARARGAFSFRKQYDGQHI
jgi:hypothetical protein